MVRPTALTVAEGGSGEYTMVLTRSPTGPVTVEVTVSGSPDVTALPVSLTFTASDWNAAQTVTVSAAHDGDAVDDTATVSHTVSGGGYGSVTASSVEVTITDDDERGVVVSPTALTMAEGGSGEYTVVLTSEPTGPVTVEATVSGSPDVTALPVTRTFTPSDWDMPQAVTVSAAHDGDAVDDTATVSHAASGGDYGGVTPEPVEVTVTDDETESTEVALTLSPQVVSEGAGSAGQTVTVTGTLNSGTRAEATAVTVTVGGGTATDGDDFTPVSDFTLTIPADATSGTTTFTLVPVDDDLDEDDETLTVSGTTTSGLTVTPASLTVTITDDEDTPTLSVADAQGAEDAGSIAFTVTLSGASSKAVTVDWETSDGTATAGIDYEAVSGTLTFAAHQTERQVTVPVLDDAVDEADERFSLRLNNPVNALLGDAEAVGTITMGRDALPQAWLARFGRTAADHTAQAIARRLEAGERETQVTVAGRRLAGLMAGLRSGGMPAGDLRLGGIPLGGLATGDASLGSVASEMLTGATSGLAASAARSAHPDGPGAGSGESAESLHSAVLPDIGFRLPAIEEALLGSSFYVEGGAQQAEGGGKTWAAWGDVAATHFEGDASGLALQGDVVTGTVGLDRQWQALLVGLAVSRSTGEGAYGTGGGTMTSTLTSLHPYLRVRLGERTQVWGATGWGRGGLELTPVRGPGIEADLSNSMAALGARAVLRRAGPTESPFEIALRSDLLWTTTSSNETAALTEATGTASRGRLLLESAAQVYGLGGVLRPRVEGGLRYDGGDAETGQGFEVGGGLGWVRGALTVEVNGRMLVAHADESYQEWGYGGSLVYEPGNDNLGLQMRVGAAAGAVASGVQNLWGIENANGLVRPDRTAPEQRFDAELGYGLGGRMLWYPYVASDANGQRRFGLKLSSGTTLGAGLEFGRRQTVGQGPEDALLLRGEMRF